MSKSWVPNKSIPLARNSSRIDDASKVVITPEKQKALDRAKEDTINIRPSSSVSHQPRKPKATASGQGSQALMLGAQATASISPPSAPPTAPAPPASSRPLPKPAPDPASRRPLGKDPVRNNGTTFTLLSTPPRKLVQCYRQTVSPLLWVLTCFQRLFHHNYLHHGPDLRIRRQSSLWPSLRWQRLSPRQLLPSHQDPP